MNAEEMTMHVCPSCGGTGKKGLIRCGICHGTGWGAVSGETFLFWGRRIDGFALFIAGVKRAVDLAIDIALIVAGLAGLGLLAWHIVAVEPSTLLTLRSWQAPDPRMLGFWVGLVALALWYYRAVMAQAKHDAVRQRAYGEHPGTLMLPPDETAWQAVHRLPSAKRIDASKSYDRRASDAIDAAYRLAQQLQHVEVRPVHLFGALLSDRLIGVLFGRLGKNFKDFKDKYTRMLAAVPGGGGTPVLTDATRRVLLAAYDEAVGARLPQVGTTELFMATLRADRDLQEMLYDMDVDVQKVENVVQWIRFRETLRRRFERFSAAARLKPKGNMNRAMTATATPFLDRISLDLTRMAAIGNLMPVSGRAKEFDAVFRAIEGGNRSVVLVGQPGVGKDAVVQGIAQRMVEEDVPKVLQDKRLVSVDLAQLVSGASAADAQQRLLALMYEVARAGNIALVFENVVGMVGISAGTGASIDLSQVLAGELSRGYCFAIATATPKEYAKSLESSPLGRTLTKVDIPEPEINDAIQILETHSGAIEYQQKVYFSYDAIDAAVRMTDRYVHERFLPEKAIDIAKEVAQAVRNKRGDGATVGEEDVAALLSEKTGIPLKQLTEEESEKLLSLEQRLHERVIGQEQAVAAVSAAMRRAGTELREQSRPIANFLFLGPTGVGKTELAKSLAEAYFGAEDAMIRLDMSEYQDKASLYKLIGEPAGEQAGGILSEAVRKQPFALLLLDELEKAHPDILTVFLQVMDDGRLTDNTGRTIDFTNVIIIATSNAGSQFIQDQMRAGTPVDRIRDELVSGKLKDSFRPEFLNRFDAVTVFTPLSPDEILKVTDLMLQKVSARLEEKGIRFKVTDDAKRELARQGFDPLYGARPLRRVIQDKVDNAVAEALLKGQVGRRDTVIYDVGGKLRIEKAKRL